MSHQIAIRVYYEDTDFSGRVYHASYLRFMERGRTEWLRACGYQQKDIAAAAGLIFVVRELHIAYLAAAAMDDELTVLTTFEGVKGAVLSLSQQVVRSGKVLVDAKVAIVAVREGRPVRLPQDLQARLQIPG